MLYANLWIASPERSLGSNHVVFGGMMLPESAMSTRTAFLCCSTLEERVAVDHSIKDFCLLLVYLAGEVSSCIFLSSRKIFYKILVFSKWGG